MTPTGPPPQLTSTATFVDNLGLLRGARSPATVSALLQLDLDARLARAPLLNITLAPAKAALIHITPTHVVKHLTPTPVQLGAFTIQPTASIMVLGVIVDD